MKRCDFLKLSTALALTGAAAACGDAVLSDFVDGFARSTQREKTALPQAEHFYDRIAGWNG